jgi:hypothetical protein
MKRSMHGVMKGGMVRGIYVVLWLGVTIGFVFGYWAGVSA